ncbi:MAG: GNAT family N-acetyltransferase [Nanoarchaeota archaeon]|nr:GNAT family N-acetyltransferase [Nanoarchaeota archaeon]
MAPKIELRKYKVSDAKRFFEILNNPNFKYLRICPKNVAGEEEFLRKSKEKRKNNISHDYAIIYNGKLVGGSGIKIDQHRKFIGEIGYFLDENYWGKGITTKAVKLLEKIGFEELGLKRITIIMHPKNIGSEKVAIKNSYKKEGTMKKTISHEGKYADAHLYAKTK